MIAHARHVRVTYSHCLAASRAIRLNLRVPMHATSLPMKNIRLVPAQSLCRPGYRNVDRMTQARDVELFTCLRCKRECHARRNWCGSIHVWGMRERSE
jgi:hypothetical protein